MWKINNRRNLRNRLFFLIFWFGLSFPVFFYGVGLAVPEFISEDGYTYFKEEFILNKANPSRTFRLNESIDYLGVFKVHVKHSNPRDLKNRAFELNWTSSTDFPLLANRSEVNLDTSWTFFFANLSATKNTAPEFTVFLKGNIEKLALGWMFYFNFHTRAKLSPQNPGFNTGSTKSTLNSTWMSFLGVLPSSTSNVTFQIEGGYEDENKTYLVSPNSWLIHNSTLRDREKSFPHTIIKCKLENLSGTAEISFLHFKIAWDPDVDQNLDTAGIEVPETLALVLGSFTLVITLTKRRRKKG